MDAPIFIPCKPYKRELYRIETDSTELSEIDGFYIRIQDVQPHSAVPFVESAGRFILVGPHYKDL